MGRERGNMFFTRSEGSHFNFRRDCHYYYHYHQYIWSIIIVITVFAINFKMNVDFVRSYRTIYIDWLKINKQVFFFLIRFMLRKTVLFTILGGVHR